MQGHRSSNLVNNHIGACGFFDIEHSARKNSLIRRSTLLAPLLTLALATEKFYALHSSWSPRNHLTSEKRRTRFSLVSRFLGGALRREWPAPNMIL